MQVGHVVASYLPWAFPALLGVSQLYERVALWSGRSGMGRFVERDGALMDRDYFTRMKQAERSWGQMAAMQLAYDLVSPMTLVFLVNIVAALVVGSYTFGLVLVALFAWLFVSNLRQMRSLASGPRFEARLVSLKGPTFLGYGVVTASKPDGTTFTTGVPWRPIKWLQPRGPVDLLFGGSPTSPLFIGVRPPDHPEDEAPHAKQISPPPSSLR